jgi:hypothetical protein
MAAGKLSPMTNQLFDRLTQPADPSKRKDINYTLVTSYTYTPQKPLRRVLDHALDHLNQIDQWQRWRHEGVVPVPTDGWVPSTVTLPEDRLPPTAADLDAWLWRIDQAMLLLTHRAAALSDDDPHWQPPGRGMSAPRRPASRRPFRGAVTQPPSTRHCPMIPSPDMRSRRSHQQAPRRSARQLQTIGRSSLRTRTGFFTPAGVVAEVLALESEPLDACPRGT